MSKCSVTNCEYYSSKNGKCSLHNNSEECFKIIYILDNFIKNNLENIITTSQSIKLINILGKIEKNNAELLDTVFESFMIYFNKKYILAELAYNILDLLVTDLNNSHLLVHKIYPYIIDVWNINDKHKWPAVCYYKSYDVEYHNLKKYFNREVSLKQFNIPEIPSRFKKIFNNDI